MNGACTDFSVSVSNDWDILSCEGYQKHGLQWDQERRQIMCSSSIVRASTIVHVT